MNARSQSEYRQIKRNQDSADKYKQLAIVISEPGAKTCLLVPSLSRFYAAVSPGETKAQAKVLVYRVLP